MFALGGGRAPTALPRGRFEARRAAAVPVPELKAASWIFRAVCGSPWLLSAIVWFLLLTSASDHEVTSFLTAALVSLAVAVFIFFARRDWMFYIVIFLGICGWGALFWVAFGTPVSRMSR